VAPAYRALARRTVARSLAAGVLQDTAAAKELNDFLDDPAEGHQDQ
jgi:hypothetical protein